MDIKTNRRILLVLLIWLFLKINLSFGADTISGNQSLSGDQTIVSSGGVFRLGFFTPGNSSKYYIGMWYEKIKTEQTIVWVANREQPVSDKFSSELKISNGNLVILNESKLSVWSTNVSSSSSSTVKVVLGDNGNLVLTDGSNSSNPLWQSFDNPAHTWLPGSKIAYNKKTKTHQVLTSWKNADDPSPGLFTLQLDQKDNSYTILWNRSRSYWTSGPWNGRIFSLVPEMRKDYIYDFNFVSNENESYFTYSVKPTSAFISRFVMDVSGQIKQQNYLPNNGWNLFWSQPRQQCEVYALCGRYGSCNENSLPFCKCLKGFKPAFQSEWDLGEYSGGCTRVTNLECGNNSLPNGEKDRFQEMLNMLLPENKQSLQVGSSDECESSCLDNCSCTAYAYENNECSIWTGDLLNLNQLTAAGDNSGNLYVRLAASELPNPKKKKGTIVGAVVGSVVGLLVVVGLMVFLILRRRNRTVGKGKQVEGSLVAFGYRDMQNATKNFSDKLGGGGFGSVFKGVLADSTVVAVKKLESVSQGEKQFRTEVSTIGTIQHVNLVRLRGFCSEGTKRLLVYDYMSNGSLDSVLLSGSNSNVLSWKTRYQIALGIARGLVYLHEKCRECIIHCDIKPENILLDAELCPKIADFGLAKLIGRDFSRVLTTMRGTRGYLAPEWIAGVAITSKADVFSYGMMLFELVSGRRNSDPSEDGKIKFFPTWAAKVIIEEGDALSLLDPRLERNADVEELVRVCRVACWCIQDDEVHRPSMSQVVQILEGVIDVNLPPIPRSLEVFGDDQENVVFFTESSSTSQSSRVRSNTSTTSSQTKSITSTTSSIS